MDELVIVDEPTLQFIQDSFASENISFPPVPTRITRRTWMKIQSYRKITDATKLLSNNLEVQTQNVRDQGSRIERVLAGMGVQRDMFSKRMLVNMTDISEMSQRLGLQQVDTASCVSALVKLSMEEINCKDKKQKIILEQRSIQRELQSLQHFRTQINTLADEMEKSEKTRTVDIQNWAKEASQFLRLKTNLEQKYKASQERLKSLGYNDNFSEEGVTKLQEEQIELEKQINDLADKLKAFSILPPDFRKAEEMIQLKEAELDELRQRFDAKLEESLLN